MTEKEIIERVAEINAQRAALKEERNRLAWREGVPAIIAKMKSMGKDTLCLREGEEFFEYTVSLWGYFENGRGAVKTLRRDENDNLILVYNYVWDHQNPDDSYWEYGDEDNEVIVNEEISNELIAPNIETECKDQYRQSEGMSGMDRDFLLVQKIRMGDEKAIEIFVEKYYPRILSYCQVHIGDHGYAEDMTQETFERFFRSLKQYRHYGKAANYLYVIAANTCHDYHRKHKEIATETMPEQADTRADNAEERLDVQMAFKRLPEEVREVAVLYFLQEQKQKDIAVMLGIGLPLVKYRIRRARELLAGYLGDGG